MDGLARELASAEIDVQTRAALHTARLARPLAAPAQLIDDLDRPQSVQVQIPAMIALR